MCYQETEVSGRQEVNQVLLKNYKIGQPSSVGNDERNRVSAIRNDRSGFGSH